MNDPKHPAADTTNDLNKQPSVQPNKTKTQQTTPTVNPEVEFVNRTLP